MKKYALRSLLASCLLLAGALAYAENSGQVANKSIKTLQSTLQANVDSASNECQNTCNAYNPQTGQYDLPGNKHYTMTGPHCLACSNQTPH